MLPGGHVVAESVPPGAPPVAAVDDPDGRGEAFVDEAPAAGAVEAGPGLPDATGCSAAVGVTESDPPPRNSSTSISNATTATTASTDTRRRQKTWACGSFDGYLSSSHN